MADKSAPVFGQESKLLCWQCGGWFTTGNTAEKGFTVKNPALVGYSPLRGGVCPDCHRYNVNKSKTKDESMSDTDRVMDGLCEASGLETLAEAAQRRKMDSASRKIIKALEKAGFRLHKNKLGMSASGATYTLSNGAILSIETAGKPKHFGEKAPPDKAKQKSAVSTVERIAKANPGPKVKHHFPPQGWHLYVDVNFA